MHANKEFRKTGEQTRGTEFIILNTYFRNLTAIRLGKATHS
jgi:hypothetical protein